MSAPDLPTPTKRAAAFMAANAASPVVEGHAYAGGGGRYVLENGSDFKLDLEDMRSMPMPRWLHDVR